jgi:cytoskeleton protein RodZ
MTSVGETLRAERLRRNLALEQVARETKIKSRLLDAIENNQFELLPHGVFAKSFVLQYVQFLGLDPEDFASEVQSALNPEPELPGFAVAPPEPAFKVPKVTQWGAAGGHQNSSPLPSLITLVLVMLICSGVYAVWQRSRHPAIAPVPQPVPAVVAPATAAEASRSAEQPPESPNPQASSLQANLHASLTADEPTWVRAWADGKEVMTATLEPSLIKTVDAMGEIRLRTGNAGALQITLNGKLVGPAGPKGQIRVVTMTPQGVQILVPPKPAPLPEPL